MEFSFIHHCCFFLCVNIVSVVVVIGCDRSRHRSIPSNSHLFSFVLAGIVFVVPSLSDLSFACPAKTLVLTNSQNYIVVSDISCAQHVKFGVVRTRELGYQRLV